jgi:molecular chaperone DnaK
LAGRIIGIDLGTSNSVVGAVIGGKPVVIPDREGRRIVPSVVSFLPDGHVVVGHKAKSRLVIDPLNTIYSAKRLIGRPFYAPEVKEFMAHYPFRVQEGEDRNPKIVAHGRAYAVEEVQALILRKMRQIAEAYLGEQSMNAVITVPANFTEAQRYATKVAGELANLKVTRIINEPTAAALAYGYGHGKRERIAVYDFGGGTFDITLLELRGEVFEVLATAGNTYLGGNDFDDRVVKALVEAFRRAHDYDLSGELIALQRLKAVAERLKCELSTRQHVSVEFKELIPGAVDPVTLQFRIDREEFNARCHDIVQQTFIVCDEALKLAQIKAKGIDHVVLVGGTTQIPLVRQMVSQYFQQEPLHDIDAHAVVAIGAAIYAASLDQQFYSHNVGYDRGADHVAAVLIDVTPHSLGIETLGHIMDTIIERNANIPIQRTRTFTTSSDNQTTVRIQIFEGEARTTLDNAKLGELVLTGLREAPRGEVKIDVSFSMNTDGMLDVMAVDRQTQQSQACTLNIAGSLSAEDVARLKLASQGPSGAVVSV